jgi:hypothetical protein
MDKFHQELFDVLTRSRTTNRESKAASMTLSMKEWAEKQRQDAKCANTIKTIIRESRAASISPSINQAQVIHNFLSN